MLCCLETKRGWAGHDASFSQSPGRPCFKCRRPRTLPSLSSSPRLFSLSLPPSPSSSTVLLTAACSGGGDRRVCWRDAFCLFSHSRAGLTVLPPVTIGNTTGQVSISIASVCVCVCVCVCARARACVCVHVCECVCVW